MGRSSIAFHTDPFTATAPKTPKYDNTTQMRASDQLAFFRVIV
jgi:hypothetical protein